MTHEADSKHYILKTLGCKANLYDSQLLEAELQRRGWKPWVSGDVSTSLLCIVNSCTVTDEADRQTRRLASRLGRENPAARVVVTGCGAEVDPERLAGTPGIHYVVGNQDKPRIVDLLLSKINEESTQNRDLNAGQAGQVLGSVTGYEQMLSRHPIDRDWPSPEMSFSAPTPRLDGHANKTRAFLKIQEGCNSFCTYCVIPYGRGPSRSLKDTEVLTHVRSLIEQQIKEIVITGTNVGDYGVDWGMDPNAALADLLRAVVSEKGLERLRIGSLDPTEITPALTDLARQDSRLCPHFHVSLQAAQGRVLRAMKRKYGVEQARECLTRISAISSVPGGPFVGMDIITGFPGETLEEFESGLQELKALPWSRLHVFPYSERAGTPATRMPGAVPPAERQRRARILNELSLERLLQQYQRALKESAGQALNGILLERPQKRTPESWTARLSEARQIAGLTDADSRLVWANGYTPNYLRVLIPMEQEKAERLRNQVVEALPFEIIKDVAAGEASFVARLT